MMTKKITNYLTTAQAANVLGCTRVWVWQLIKAGTLPAARVGRCWLIDPADLRSYMREHK